MLCDFGLYVWRRVVSLVIVAPGNRYHKKVEVRQCGWRYNGQANPVSKVEHETNKIKQSLPYFPRVLNIVSINTKASLQNLFIFGIPVHKHLRFIIRVITQRP